MVKVGDMYYAQAMDTNLAQKGECGGALTATIEFLLEKGLIDAALVLKKGSDLFDGVPVLIDDPEDLADSAGSLHCGTHNMAKIVIKYLDGAQNLKLAVTTKPCDARTLKELMKLGKVNPNNIIMLGVNCGGTLPPVNTRKMIEEYYGINPDDILKEEINRGKLIIETQDLNLYEMNIDFLEEAGFGRRPNCRRCDINIPFMADLAFGNWGVIGLSTGQSTFVEVFSPKGAEILENAKNEGYVDLEDPSVEGVALRAKIDDSMVKLAQKWQSMCFDDENHDLTSTITRTRKYFEKCIQCFGCRDACPIYCYEDRAIKSKAPEGTFPGEIPVPLIFHLERMINMIDSCTNCGQCEDVCPMDIPLARIWQEVNLDISNIFGYRAGINDDLPPLSHIIQLNKD